MQVMRRCRSNGLCPGPDLGLIHLFGVWWSLEGSQDMTLPIPKEFEDPRFSKNDLRKTFRSTALRLRWVATCINLLFPILSIAFELVWEFVKIHLLSTMVAWHDSLRPFIAFPAFLQHSTVDDELKRECLPIFDSSSFVSGILTFREMNKFKPFYDKINFLNVALARPNQQDNIWLFNGATHF